MSALEVWQKSCQYLYMPRLASSDVLQDTIAEGAASRDYFGLATGREDGRYLGFSYGSKTAIYLDALLLIAPDAAARHEAEIIAPPTPPEICSKPSPGHDGMSPAPAGTATSPDAPVRAALTRYFGTAELDPIRAAVDFGKIQNELIGQFTTTVGATVKIRIDIEAECSEGFDETVVRAARENGRVLGVDGSFE